MDSADAVWKPPSGKWERKRLVKRARSAPLTLSEDEENWYKNEYLDSLSLPAMAWEYMHYIEWRFSWFGLLWTLLGLVALFSGAGFGTAVVGLLALGYAAYLFAGGRFRFIIF